MTIWDYEAEFARAYPPEPITWEQYMAEEYLCRRFDILDGVRHFYTSTMAEAEIKGNLMLALFDIEDRTQCGQAMHLCFDVLIRRNPFRTRQPNLSFMSNLRADHYWREHETEPVQPAPELVVEILGRGQSVETIADKLNDYGSADVQECWAIQSEEQTVEVLRLTPTTATLAATYRAGQSLQSLVFPDLIVAVDTIFAA